MKKPRINMTIIKEESGYSATSKIKDLFIGTQGEDIVELKSNIVEAVNLAFEDKGITYEINEIELNPDLQSFFEYYNVINSKTLSEKIKMDKTLLKQYISGEKKPTISQTKRIFRGVQQIGKELASAQFFV